MVAMTISSSVVVVRAAQAIARLGGSLILALIDANNNQQM
jgi:hypothetical protein